MRRFLLWRRQDPTGVSGTGIVAEGVVFGDGSTVVRWRGETRTTTVHEGLTSVERVHCHAGATRLLWCDESYDGPRPCSILGPDGEREGVSAPNERLHDGWVEANGAVDVNDVPLFVGQRVRLVRLFGEVGNEGEIAGFYVAGGALHATVLGTDCGPTGYSVEKLAALDKTPGEVLARNGGKKPSYGWAPAVRLGKSE